MTKKGWIFFTFKIAIALIALYVVIHTVDFLKIKTALLNPQYPGFIFLAFALLIPNLAAQWYRWHYLLRLIKPDVRAMESVRSFFGGMVTGFITPGKIGEVGRSLFLRDVDRIQAVGLVFIDKLYAVLTIFIGGIWGIMWLLFILNQFASFMVWPLGLVALLMTVLAAAFMLKPEWVRTLFYYISLILPKRDKFKRIIGCIDHFKKRQAVEFALWSFALYFIYMIQFCLLAFSFQKMSWITALTATTSTMFAKTLLPISFGDLGIREGASVFFFMKLNIDKVTAFNSALLLFAINILIPVLFGLIFLPWMSWNHKKKESPTVQEK